MPEHDIMPLILLSGLAADASVFAPQLLVFPQLIVPEWPDPLPNETLDLYARRLATQLSSYGECYLGGASFGGIVALHVAQYLPVRGVILIGSIRSPDELPRYAKLARWLKPLIRFIPVRLGQFLSRPLTSTRVRRSFPHLSNLVWQFRRSDPNIFRWSLRQVLEWKTAPEISCRVFHIHGSNDRILPASLTRPDHLIEGGGHVISITHSKQVNAFIRSILFGDEENSRQ